MLARSLDGGPRRISDPFLFDQGFLASQDVAVQSLSLAGADEAGRGSLAGPLVAAAVVLDYSRSPHIGLAGLTDSKLLTPATRESLYRCVLISAKRVCWIAVSAGTIDRLGLHRCNLMALCRVLESCSAEYGSALVDGFDIARPDLRATGVVRGDYKSAAVAAASIVAKVVRDRLMRSIAPSYPEYGFDGHVGYGTEAHMAALRVHGPCRLHRTSFQGVGTPQLVLWGEQPGPADPS
jgi:ribonuclease HII